MSRSTALASSTRRTAQGPLPLAALLAGALPLPSAPSAPSSPAARINKMGLFGMVSLAAVEQIARHVAPLDGLHAWTAQSLYLALALCASQQGSASTAEGQRCRATIAELAARTRMSPRNVQRYLGVLKDAGVLRIQQRHDPLHRPVASEYVFVYPETSPSASPSAPPETKLPGIPQGLHPTVTPPPVPGDSGGAKLAGDATPAAPPDDSGVTTVAKKDLEENPERDERAIPCLRANVPAAEDGSRSPRQKQWEAARQALAGQLSAATYSAWIAPLELAERPDEPDQALVLICASPFHRERVERLHRSIEDLLGSPVQFAVRGSP